MLPKPFGNRIPLLITGGSQQPPDWVARHGDGWITFPRDVGSQAQVVTDYRDRVELNGAGAKPVIQSLYVDLLNDPEAPPRPIHLGFSSGIDYLRSYLTALETIGVNHVALNVRFNRAGIEATLLRLSEELLPRFPTKESSI